MTRRPAIPRVVLAATVALLLGACSASDMDSSDARNEMPPSGEQQGDSVEGGAAADSGGGDGSIDLPAFTPQEGRSLIVRMDVGLEVATDDYVATVLRGKPDEAAVLGPPVDDPDASDDVDATTM